MLTRSRARGARDEGVVNDDARSADAGGRSAAVARGQGKVSATPAGDDTDVEDLEMQICDSADEEFVYDDGQVDEDDPDVVVNRSRLLVSSNVQGLRADAGNARQMGAAASISQPERGATRSQRFDPPVAPMGPTGGRASQQVSKGRSVPENNRLINGDDEVVDVEESKVGKYRMPVKWIKPDKFSASTPIEAYISHFETVAEYNCWSLRDKVAHLKAALVGDAAQLLWDGGDHSAITYDELISKLKARFGSIDHRERFACQLRSLRRRPGQTLQQLYNEVRRLLALAYPDAMKSSLGEIIARDAFLSSLNDRELEIKVRDREPVDLDSAFRAAMRIETYLRPVETTKPLEGDIDRERGIRAYRDRQSGQHARQVKEPSVVQPDATAAVLRELRDQLTQSRKAQEELSRELGRVRLLAECRAETRQDAPGGCDRRDQPVQKDDALAAAGRPACPRGACFACGDPSHFARNCPTRRRDDAERGKHMTDANKEPGGGGRVRMLSSDRLDKAAYLRLLVYGEWVDCLLDTGSEVCLFPGKYAAKAGVTPGRHKLYAANGTEIGIAGEVVVEVAAGSLTFKIGGLCSNNVSEIILGLNFLKAQGAVWDFKSGTVLLNNVLFELRARDTGGMCRRIILETTAAIPPRSEAVLPAFVEFKGGIHSAGQWATRAQQVVGHVYAASGLLPNKAVNVPVRLLNAGDEDVTLQAGTVLTVADEVTCGVTDNEAPVVEGTDARVRAIADMVGQVDDSVSQEIRDELTKILEDYAGAFSFDDLDIGHATAAQHSIEVGDARPVRQRFRRQPPAHQAAIDVHVRDMLRQDIIEPAQSPWSANLVVVRKKSGEYRCCVDFRGLNGVTLKDAYSLPRIDACLDALAGSVWFSSFDLRNSYYQVELAEADRDKTAFVCRGGQYRFKRMPMGLCNSGATFQRLVDVVLSGLSYDICLAYIDDILVYSRSLPEHLSRLRTVLGRLKNAGLKIKPSKTFLLRRSVGFLGHFISAEGISTHPEKTEQILNWGTPRCVRDVRAFIGITSYYRKFVKDYAITAAPLTALTGKNRPFLWSAQCEDAFVSLKRALASPPILAMPIDGGQYVLDTDSSDFAIGAVLSQVQNGEERVIAYASRHLCKREQNYCVTRRELLAVVFYLKYFRHYLLGAALPTKVRTDHAAIQWLRRIPEPVGQQARWLEIMEEFEISIEHRVGRSHGNADAMSRDPCHNRRCCPQFEQSARVASVASLGYVEDRSVREEGGAGNEIPSAIRQIAEVDVVREEGVATARTGDVTPEFVGVLGLGENVAFLAEQQRADPDISKITDLMERGTVSPTWDEVASQSESTKSLWRQWQRLMLKDGVLVRRFEEANGRSNFWQVIIPKQLRAKFLSAVHAGVAGGHFGRHRTELAVKARAYWPGWAGDVRRALRTCEACTRYMRSKPPRQVTLKPILCGEPWEILSLDITGPHPVSKQGFMYILTMQDHFSKWAEAVPIRRHTAPIVARAVFEQVFMRFGAARRLLTDQGPEFESELLAELCRLMDVDKIRTSPYHPQSNGMLERFHRVLNSMLAKVIDEDQRNWPDHLPTVMAAYRASVHEATGFSPNRLILGREARLPVDLVFGVPPDREQTVRSYDQFVDEQAERMYNDFQTVRENLGRMAQLRMDKYIIKRNVPPLSVGDKVWYFCPRRKSNRSPKWQNFYTGPYEVVRIIDSHVIVIRRSQRSRPFTVHRDKLKPVMRDGELTDSAFPVGKKRAEEIVITPNASDASGITEMAARPKRVRQAPRRYDNFCCAVSLFTVAVTSTMKRRGKATDHPAECQVCGTTYRDGSDLARHLKTQVHAARVRGQSPTGRAKGGLAKRDRRTALVPANEDEDPEMVALVRSVIAVPDNDRSAVAVAALSSSAGGVIRAPGADQQIVSVQLSSAGGQSTEAVAGSGDEPRGVASTTSLGPAETGGSDLSTATEGAAPAASAAVSPPPVSNQFRGVDTKSAMISIWLQSVAATAEQFAAVTPSAGTEPMDPALSSCLQNFAMVARNEAVRFAAAYQSSIPTSSLAPLVVSDSVVPDATDPFLSSGVTRSGEESQESTDRRHDELTAGSTQCGVTFPAAVEGHDEPSSAEQSFCQDIGQLAGYSPLQRSSDSPW